MADEIVAPVIASAFRELAPTYLVRDIFSNKRDEITRAAPTRLRGVFRATGSSSSR